MKSRKKYIFLNFFEKKNVIYTDFILKKSVTNEIKKYNTFCVKTYLRCYCIITS